MEFGNFRTSILITFRSRQTDRCGYGCSFFRHSSIYYADAGITTVSNVHFSVVGETNLARVSEFGVLQQAVFPALPVHNSFVDCFSCVWFSVISVFIFRSDLGYVHSPNLVKICKRYIEYVFFSFNRAECDIGVTSCFAAVACCYIRYFL